MKLGITLLIVLLTFCGCLFGPDSKTVHYTGQIVLDFEVLEIIEHECIDGEIDITPKIPSSDYLYLIESADDIDSVFYAVNYYYEWTPHLEEFLPEEGMLLVFFRNAAYEDSYNGHSISLSGDTISVDISIEEYEGDEAVAPGFNPMVIPIGVIPAEYSH